MAKKKRLGFEFGEKTLNIYKMSVIVVRMSILVGC